MTKQLILTTLGCAFIASAQPSVVSISPLSGNGTTATFTSVYHDPQGRHYLAYLLVLPTPNIVWFTAKGSCLVEYNTYSNGVRLIDDPGTGWLGGQSGVRGPVLSNNACSVNTALVQASYSPATKNLTVTVPLTINPALSGPLTTFIQEQDSTGVWTGMTQFGTWRAHNIASPKAGPYVASIIHPAYTTLGPSRVEVTVGHTSGVSNLDTVNILLADNIVGGANRCHIIYFGTTHAIELVNDAGTGFSTTNPRANSTCAIHPNPTTGTTQQVRLDISMLFNPDRVKSRLNIWVNVFDKAGNLTHWLDRASLGQ